MSGLIKTATKKNNIILKSVVPFGLKSALVGGVGAAILLGARHYIFKNKVSYPGCKSLGAGVLSELLAFGVKLHSSQEIQKYNKLLTEYSEKEFFGSDFEYESYFSVEIKKSEHRSESLAS